MKKLTLTIDISASSGQHIVGWMEHVTIQTKAVSRFPNGVHQADGHLVWDIEALLREVKKRYPCGKSGMS